MASLRRFPNSPYWFACIIGPDGSRRQVSTKVRADGIEPNDLKRLSRLLGKFGLKVERDPAQPHTPAPDAREARRLAMHIASLYENTARQGKAGELTDAQARKVVSEIYSAANPDSLGSATVRDFLASWLRVKSIEAGEKTHLRYELVVRDLLDHLGDRAGRDLLHLDANDIRTFRDAVARRTSASTATFSLKVIRAALNQAMKDGLLDRNVAMRVSTLKRVGEGKRRAFTLDELKRILAVATEEWRAMILTGLYTGLRLGDVARLTWTAVDLEQKVIRLVSQKTARPMEIPIASPLVRCLEAFPAGDNPQQPLFPRAFERYERSYFNGDLSKEFRAILVSAGLAAPHKSQETGEGHRVPHRQSELSFHALRHTATSLLKNAGVSDAIARDIIGHDSPEVSRHYTHIGLDAKREAVDRLPDVTAAPADPS